MKSTHRPFITVKATRDKETLKAEATWFAQVNHIRRYGPPKGYKAYGKWLAKKGRPHMGLTGFDEQKEAVNE